MKPEMPNAKNCNANVYLRLAPKASQSWVSSIGERRAVQQNTIRYREGFVLHVLIHNWILYNSLVDTILTFNEGHGHFETANC